VTVDIDGRSLLAYNDLCYNCGGQDYSNLGAWPWHGVFTVDQGGILTRWDITTDGSSTGDCTAIVYSSGAGGSDIVQP